MPSLTRRVLLLVAAVITATTIVACKPPASSTPSTVLFGRKIAETGPGKPLVLEFYELSRRDKTSTVRHVFTSGASVPSSMWFARCACALAKARGATHFIVLSDGAGDQVIGFANSGTVDPQT